MKLHCLICTTIMTALVLNGCTSVEGKIEKAYDCCKKVCDRSIERHNKLATLEGPDLDKALMEALKKEKRDTRINCYSECREGKDKCLEAAKDEPELWKDVWKSNCDKIAASQKRVMLVATLDNPDLDGKLELAMQKELREIEKECYSCCSSE